MRVFESKRDGWITAVIAGANLMLVAAAWVSRQTIFVPIFALAVVALTTSILLRTRCELDGDTLTVRSGPLRWRIDVRKIRRAFPTDDPSSAPALSLDRVQIDYAKEDGTEATILVSPAEKEAFLAALGAPAS